MQDSLRRDRADLAFLFLQGAIPSDTCSEIIFRVSRLSIKVIRPGLEIGLTSFSKQDIFPEVVLGFKFSLMINL